MNSSLAFTVQLHNLNLTDVLFTTT